MMSLITIVFLMGACKSNKQNKSTQQIATGDTSMNALDWEGFYTGTVPCADCQGIQTTLKLSRNNTYILRTKYLGTDDDGRETTGKFEWNKTGNIVTLKGIENAPAKYLVGEGRVFQLDMQGNRISGANADHYILTKVNDDLVEKYWKLVELNGQPVKFDDKMGEREPHIIFKIDGNRVNGNAGCNSFFGTYELQPGNRIKFSQVGSTMMACIDMDVEKRFLEVLNMADNYNVTGDKLVLNRARMAPLARFEAVYF